MKMSSLVWGSHTGEAYSSWGLTIALYAFSLSDFFCFCFNGPIVYFKWGSSFKGGGGGGGGGDRESLVLFLWKPIRLEVFQGGVQTPCPLWICLFILTQYLLLCYKSPDPVGMFKKIQSQPADKPMAPRGRAIQ